MKSTQQHGSDALAAAALFTALFGLYLFTAVPAVLFEDTGEFAVGSIVLGVSHPPGYPLYLLLGRLCAFLPVAEPAFSVVVFSCLAGAAGCCIVFAACRALGFSSAASLLAGALLGVSRTLWSQCAIPEVYAIGLFLAAVQFYLVVLVWKRRSPGLLAASAVVLALNFLNHYIVCAAYAPVVLVLFLIMIRERRISVKYLPVGLFLVACLASITVYLPLRAAAEPALSWGAQAPTTLGHLLEHLRRSEFSFWENQLVFHLPTKWRYFMHLLEGLPSEFSFWFVFLGCMGIFLLMVERLRVFAFLVYLFLVQTVGVILFINFHYSTHQIFVFRVFYISAYMIFAVCAACGVDGVGEWLRRTGRAGLGRAMPALLCLLVVWPLVQNMPYNQWQHESRPLRFGRDIYRSMRRDALFFLQGAIHSPPAGYLYIVKNLRRDIVFIDGHGNMERGQYKAMNKKYRFMDVPEITRSLTREQLDLRPVYTANKIGADPDDFNVALLGPVYRVGQASSCNMGRFESSWESWAPYGKTRNFNTDYLEVMVDMRLAECDFIQERPQAALDRLKDTGVRFKGSPLIFVTIAGLLEQFGKQSFAEQTYRRALEFCPTYTDAHRSLGDIYLRRGQISKAIEQYETTLKYTPNNYIAILNLANLHQSQGDYQDAVDLYKKVLEFRPDAALAYKQMGIALEGLKQWNEAENAYKKAIAMSPGLALAYNDLGAFYIARGDYTNAIINLEKFLEFEPDNPTGHFNLGLANEKIGDTEAAIEAFKNVIALEPDSDKSIESMKRLLYLYRSQNREPAAVDFFNHVKEKYETEQPKLSQFADILIQQVVKERQQEQALTDGEN